MALILFHVTGLVMKFWKKCYLLIWNWRVNRIVTIFKIVFRFVHDITRFNSWQISYVEFDLCRKNIYLDYWLIKWTLKEDSAVLEHLREKVTDRNFSGIRSITNTLVMFLIHNYINYNWFCEMVCAFRKVILVNLKILWRTGTPRSTSSTYIV